MGRSSTSALGLAALVAASSGCAEPPSYRLRWAVDGQTLSTPAGCSTVGVLEIEVATIDALGRLTAVNRYPCFGEYWEDPDTTVAGPTVPPGIYALQVRGVSRNGVAWVDGLEQQQQEFEAAVLGENYASLRYDLCRPRPPEGAPVQAKARDVLACRPEDLVCDCSEVEVIEGAVAPTIDGFNLPAPPQCIDGVDNDLDGLTDGLDTACGGEFNLADEAADISRTTFDITVSFWAHNPNATCTAIAPAIGQTGLTFVVEIDELEVQRIACRADAIRFVRELPSGEHTLSVRLVNGADETLATAYEQTVEVLPEVGGAFFVDADFGQGDFVDPATGPAFFTAPGLPFEGAPPRSCAPLVNEGRLQLAGVRMTLLDGRGEPVPGATLDDGVIDQDGNVITPATPMDGSTVIPCNPGTLRTTSVSWGEFLIAFEALSAEGEVCFSNVQAPAPAAPHAAFQVALPRVADMPDSCKDCDEDSECGANVCEGNVCVPPCADDDECGDGVCLAGHCEAQED